MSERFKRYSRNKFNEWRQRVNKYIPDLVISIYSAKIEGFALSRDEEKLLGYVIGDLSNPYYSITDYYGKRLEYDSVIADQITLEIRVSELFKIKKRISIKPD